MTYRITDLPPDSVANATDVTVVVDAATNITKQLAIQTLLDGSTAPFSNLALSALAATGVRSSSTYLRGDGTWATVSGGSGTGDTVGPASATDNAIVRFDTTTGKLIQNSTVTLSDGGNYAVSLSGSTEGFTLTNGSTGRGIFIDQNGATGANLIDSGALVIDNTDNQGIALQVYTNSTQTDYRPILFYAANAANNNPLLQLTHMGTGGGAAHIRMDGPSPQMEFVETDQVAPAGKFEIQVQGDIFFINGRKADNSQFDPILEILRPELGGSLGIGGNPYNIEKLTITDDYGGAPRIALKETTAPTLDAGFGKIYVKSSDHSLYYMNASGTEGLLSNDSAVVHIAGSETITGTKTFQNAQTVFAGNTLIQDLVSSPTKAYRMRTSGSNLDFDIAASTMYLSGYANADFTGTQNFFAGFNPSGAVDAFGPWYWHTAPFAATKLTIDPSSTSVLTLGADIALGTNKIKVGTGTAYFGSSSARPYINGGGDDIEFQNFTELFFHQTNPTISLFSASDQNLNITNTGGAKANLVVQNNVSVGGTLTYSGSTSGTTTVQATAVASGTLTLPAATDTLVGKATTDTLTNKSITSPNILTGATVRAGASVSYENAAANAYMNISNAGGTGVAYLAVTGGNLNVTSNRLGVGLNNAGSAYIETISDGSSSLQGLRIKGTASTDIAFSTFVSGDAQLRFLFAPTGQMDWGSGAAVSDTHLSRTGVAELTLQSTLKLATLTATGAVTSSGGGIGYATGAGGTVTQATSKATGVTLNKLSGAITLNAAALAAATTVSFVLTNSFIAATDLLVLNHTATGSFGSYNLNAHGAAAGSITIDVRNISAGSLSEAIVLSFAVIKAVTA
jgi:hypothetical protein